MENNKLSTFKNLKKEELEKFVGKKVFKPSQKPFKSTLKVNTIKSVETHPNKKHLLAFSFIEDDSFVSVSQCEIFKG